MFETLRVYGGVPFAWSRHLARLLGAAAALGIDGPDPVALRGAVDAVVRADGIVEGRVRVTVLARGEGAAGADVIAGAGPLVAVRSPAAVIVAGWPRNERAVTVGLKSTAYADNVRAFADARAAGADECVFANTRGELCEATGSNVFVVEHGVVRTPPAGSGCLLGVTRALVIEVARSVGLVVEEVDRPIGVLTTADEVFLTSTTREVLPVGSVDGVTRRGPGPVTRRLAAAWGALVAGDLDP